MALHCLRCAGALTREEYEGIPIDRCGGCGGVWLDHRELRQVVGRREKRFTPEEIGRINELRKEALAEEQKEDSRISCLICAATLERANYPETKIVIDRCAGHGTWLDAGELERIQLAAERYEKILKQASKPAAKSAPRPPAGAAPKGPWRCMTCGETGEEQFTECWKCGRGRFGGGTPRPIEEPEKEEEEEESTTSPASTAWEVTKGVLCALHVVVQVAGVIAEIAD